MLEIKHRKSVPLLPQHDRVTSRRGFVVFDPFVYSPEVPAFMAGSEVCTFSKWSLSVASVPSVN